MKNWFAANRRLFGLLAVLLPLAGLLVFVALRAGPLAAVPVTVAAVQSQALAPALFGIGTVEARYTHRIGPTFAGRVATVAVQPGDAVRAGQEVGEMDPIDLDERLVAQEAGLRRAEANVLAAQAQVREVGARRSFADAQATRYTRLLQSNSVSSEAAAAKRQEADGAAAAHQATTASAEAAKQELSRLRAERDALRAQRANLRLVAPVDGLVVRRDADPGTTVVAGQAVVRLIDPASLWVDARFDQISAQGLAAGLPAEVALRSRPGQPLAARVLRTEPLADAVTEELLAKIVFDALPEPLPPIGELAELTVRLPALPESPTIPNAALRTVAGQRGVWKITDGALAFAPVRLGRADLDGQVQVLDGLAVGDSIVLYSEKALTTKSRVHVVERIAGVAP